MLFELKLIPLYIFIVDVPIRVVGVKDRKEAYEKTKALALSLGLSFFYSFITNRSRFFPLLTGILAGYL